MMSFKMLKTKREEKMKKYFVVTLCMLFACSLNSCKDSKAKSELLHTGLNDKAKGPSINSVSGEAGNGFEHGGADSTVSDVASIVVDIKTGDYIKSTGIEDTGDPVSPKEYKLEVKESGTGKISIVNVRPQKSGLLSMAAEVFTINGRSLEVWVGKSESKLEFVYHDGKSEAFTIDCNKGYPQKIVSKSGGRYELEKV
jgi:hypothetical protein